ncbi:Ger(x)C family spore germination protein [Alkaliphilus peptidifermentans]|uniref:Spore germination protein n=1 Tax=Alkaliphilus peptidifermentans DSM 18978 TaxID=1120976 RepID=A0A1G5EWH2_9FIRM|nr:Ger(x)C family spore germination protein [Alkaliphilus peptidifermentans]SCY31171.1 spore germination protein [Alkaliphilus peptidifermentans DSM 18978]
MNKIFKIMILFLTTLLLISCWDQKIYEKIGFVLNIGIEKADNDMMLITLTNPVVGAQQEREVEIITTTAHSLREAREQGRLISPKNLEGGKTQHILLSSEMAEGGIHNLLEVFQRDPINPALVQIVVVDGSPHELMKASLTFNDKPRSAFYINQLLENNITNGYIPETRIYNFDIAHFAPGLDPITPMIKLEENGVKIIGSALFSGDKMVGKIDTKLTSLLLAAMGKLGKSSYFISNYYDEKLKIEFYTAVLLRTVKRKIEIEIRENNLAINMMLTFDITLDDHTWDRTDEEVTQNTLEKNIAKAIKADYLQLFNYMQEVGCDPVGFGDLVRAKHNKYWQSIEWQEIYKDAEINIDVVVDIKQYGAIK